MCETHKYSNGLLELNFRADVASELVEALRALNAGKTPAIGLGFQFWIRHQPRFLALLTPDFLDEVWDGFLRSEGPVHAFGCPLDDEMPACPLKTEDFLRTPVIVDDNPNNAFLRLYPLIFRAYGYPERYCASLATGGIEFTVTGWMTIMDEFFRFLEGEAVALKSHGFLDTAIPLLAKVKEKMGSIRVYTHQVPRLIAAEVQMRRAALEEESSRTCILCGAPGAPRYGGWIRTVCDSCEQTHQEGAQS
jgi:hypothetical protein